MFSCAACVNGIEGAFFAFAFCAGAFAAAVAAVFVALAIEDLPFSQA